MFANGSCILMDSMGCGRPGRVGDTLDLLGLTMGAGRRSNASVPWNFPFHWAEKSVLTGCALGAAFGELSDTGTLKLLQVVSLRAAEQAVMEMVCNQGTLDS
jgi:hypothetical protein